MTKKIKNGTGKKRETEPFLITTSNDQVEEGKQKLKKKKQKYYVEKKKDIFVLRKILIIAMFLSMLSLAQAYEWSDGFDDADITDWTTVTAAGVVEASVSYKTNGTHSLRIQDNNGGALSSATYTFAGNQTTFNLTANAFVQGANARLDYNLVNHTGSNIARMIITDSYISFTNNSGTFQAQAASTSNWYRLNIYFDGTSYYCYVNGTEYCFGKAILPTFTDYDKVKLSTTNGANPHDSWTDQIELSTITIPDNITTHTAINNITGLGIQEFAGTVWHSNGTLVSNLTTLSGSIEHNMSNFANGTYYVITTIDYYQIKNESIYWNESRSYQASVQPNAMVLNFSQAVDGVYQDSENLQNFSTTPQLIYVGNLPLGEVSVQFNPSATPDGNFTQFYEFFVEGAQDTVTEQIQVFADTDSQLYFQILDSNSIPIRYATVRMYSGVSTDTLTSKDNHFRGQHLTGDDGLVLIYFNYEETVWLVISKDGYTTRTVILNYNDLTVQTDKSDAEPIYLVEDNQFQHGIGFFGDLTYNINTTEKNFSVYAPNVNSLWYKTDDMFTSSQLVKGNFDTYYGTLTAGTHFTPTDANFNLTLYNGLTILQTFQYNEIDTTNNVQLFNFSGAGGKVFSIGLLILVLLVANIARWKFNSTTAGFNLYMTGLVIISIINTAFLWAGITAGMYYATKTLYKVINK